MIEKLKEPKPEKFSEIPGYLRRVTTKFLHRLFYIFMLVWETKPWILFFMVFMAVWNGVTPVISSIIGKELLNSLASAYTSVTQGLENKFDTVIMLLVIRFGFNFITGMVSRLSNILNNIANELVVNHINLKIMYKAREVDLASFDLPEFYERFENAKREAGSRPIQILNNNFTIISTVISMLSFIIILGSSQSVRTSRYCGSEHSGGCHQLYLPKKELLVRQKTLERPQTDVVLFRNHDE